MATFIAQLFAFAIIVFVLVRYVVPPVRRMMRAQQEQVRQQLTDNETSTQQLAKAEQAHTNAVAEAKAEAVQIREEARADADQIRVQMREQADQEVERITQHGREQVALHREMLIRELRAELGAAAVARADQRVRTQLEDPAARSRTVDNVLDELEQMAGDRAAPSRPEGVS